MKKLVQWLAQIADRPGIDWLGLSLSLVTLVAVTLGFDVDSLEILLGSSFAALGRGVLITAKRKMQQSAMIAMAESAKVFVGTLRVPAQAESLGVEEDRQG